MKNIFPVVLCILIGFFMGTIIIRQYNKTPSVDALTGEKLYFLQTGVYSSLESMKESMKEPNYYIYTKENNMYYSYIGITKNKKNLQLLQDFYTSMGYDIYIREFFITNISFLTVLEQYDNLLLETTDKKIIKAIENQVINKYEELIINDKN